MNTNILLLKDKNIEIRRLIYIMPYESLMQYLSKNQTL